MPQGAKLKQLADFPLHASSIWDLKHLSDQVEDNIIYVILTDMGELTRSHIGKCREL